MFHHKKVWFRNARQEFFVYIYVKMALYGRFTALQRKCRPTEHKQISDIEDAQYMRIRMCLFDILC